MKTNYQPREHGSQSVVEPIIGAMREQSAAGIAAVRETAAIGKDAYERQLTILEREVAALRAEAASTRARPTEMSGAWEAVGKALEGANRSGLLATTSDDGTAAGETLLAAGVGVVAEYSDWFYGELFWGNDRLEQAIAWAAQTQSR